MVKFRGGAVTMYDGIRRESRGGTVSQAPSRALSECLMQKPAPRLSTGDR